MTTINSARPDSGNRAGPGDGFSLNSSATMATAGAPLLASYALDMPSNNLALYGVGAAVLLKALTAIPVGMVALSAASVAVPVLGVYAGYRGLDAILEARRDLQAERAAGAPLQLSGMAQFDFTPALERTGVSYDDFARLPVELQKVWIDTGNSIHGAQQELAGQRGLNAGERRDAMAALDGAWQNLNVQLRHSIAQLPTAESARPRPQTNAPAPSVNAPTPPPLSFEQAAGVRDAWITEATKDAPPQVRLQFAQQIAETLDNALPMRGDPQNWLTQASGWLENLGASNVTRDDISAKAWARAEETAFALFPAATPETVGSYLDALGAWLESDHPAATLVDLDRLLNTDLPASPATRALLENDAAKRGEFALQTEPASTAPVAGVPVLSPREPVSPPPSGRPPAGGSAPLILPPDPEDVSATDKTAGSDGTPDYARELGLPDAGEMQIAYNRRRREFPGETEATARQAVADQFADDAGIPLQVARAFLDTLLALSDIAPALPTGASVVAGAPRLSSEMIEEIMPHLVNWVVCKRQSNPATALRYLGRDVINELIEKFPAYAPFAAQLRSALAQRLGVGSIPDTPVGAAVGNNPAVIPDAAVQGVSPELSQEITQALSGNPTLARAFAEHAAIAKESGASENDIRNELRQLSDANNELISAVAAHNPAWANEPWSNNQYGNPMPPLAQQLQANIAALHGMNNASGSPDVELITSEIRGYAAVIGGITGGGEASSEGRKEYVEEIIGAISNAIVSQLPNNPTVRASLIAPLISTGKIQHESRVTLIKEMPRILEGLAGPSIGEGSAPPVSSPAFEQKIAEITGVIERIEPRLDTSDPIREFSSRGVVRQVVRGELSELQAIEALETLDAVNVHGKTVPFEMLGGVIEALLKNGGPFSVSVPLDEFGRNLGVAYVIKGWGNSSDLPQGVQDVMRSGVLPGTTAANYSHIMQIYDLGRYGPMAMGQQIINLTERPSSPGYTLETRPGGNSTTANNLTTYDREQIIEGEPINRSNRLDSHQQLELPQGARVTLHGLTIPGAEPVLPGESPDVQFIVPDWPE